MDFTSNGARYDFVGKPLPIGQLQIELHPREGEESAFVPSDLLHSQGTEMAAQSPRITPVLPLSSPGGRRWRVLGSDLSGPSQTWSTSTSLLQGDPTSPRFVHKTPYMASLVADQVPTYEQYSFINIRGNHELIVDDSDEFGPR
jgi:hypothetical protein